MTSLLQIRDEAFSESEQAHARIQTELAIFKNKGYISDKRVGPITAQVKESLVPQISTGCLRLIPAFREQMAEIAIEPDELDADEQTLMLLEVLSAYAKMYEELDDEGGRMEAGIYRNLTVGNAVSKIKWDNAAQIVRCENINPVNFAPDPACSQANLSDAAYVCQKNHQNTYHLRRYYPKWRAPYSENEGGSDATASHRVDEIWMTRDVAEDCGVRVADTKRQIILATLIDDRIYEVRGSPFWYPHFPYAVWRNFLDMQSEGKDHGFWGYGYGTLCWSQQKVVDEFVANLILMLRNLGVGRYKSLMGAIDEEQITQEHGAVLRINEGFRMDDLEQIPPEQIPSIIGEFIQFVSQAMAETMPSLSEVFTGDAPFAGASGRAVQTLQFANFNQLSANIRNMNEFRTRRKRIQVVLTQQFARKPQSPHLWRGGLDLPTPFPDDARYLGYHLQMPDHTQLPNTPVGKIEMLAQLAQMGYIPKNPLELLGLTKGYGWSPDQFDRVTLAPPTAAQQPNADVAAGIEPGMPSERGI